MVAGCVERNPIYFEEESFLIHYIHAHCAPYAELQSNKSTMKIRISGMYTAWFRYKMSGSGREGGQYGLEAYTEVKTVITAIDQKNS